MIVDANIVVYWFTPSEFAGSVARFRGRTDLVAPAIILPEAANVLYKNARGGRITAESCVASVALIERALRELIPDKNLLPAALELALTKNHPVYDCLYLALAMERREPLATADRRLAALAGQLGIDVELLLPA